jgi:hypothetical protein
MPSRLPCYLTQNRADKLGDIDHRVPEWDRFDDSHIPLGGQFHAVRVYPQLVLGDSTSQELAIIHQRHARGHLRSIIKVEQ